MAEIILKVILFAVLLFCGVQDLRKRKILLWVIMAGVVLTGICLPFCHTVTIMDRIGGAAIGATVAIISIVTAGKIGMGDALLLCLTGLGLGFWGNIELFAFALLLASIISIALLILRLADRKKSIPFVPFILASYLILIMVGR
jgi:leader peptidase (prepilin peptidase) / N-methyltransferase